MIGTKLAHYEITHHLGLGGMGDVYQATDSSWGAALRLSCCRKRLCMTRTERRDSSAKHVCWRRSIIPISRPFTALKNPADGKFLVMELVLGETLAERIKRGPIPLDEALPIAKQIAEALEAAHEKGIIHRDLKPPNIKITPQGQVKVLDFGLGKAFAAEATAADLSDLTRLTDVSMPGVILGTPPYMSPEQARGRPVDRRTDIWSFGCVLYEMLTGRKVFPVGETVSDMLAGVLERDPDWRPLPAATPQQIRTLLERCLRKDAARRLRDIGDAKIEIEEAESEHTASPVAASAPAPSRRARFWFGGSWR
jgi:serine/threonine protein kinase